MKKIYHFSIIFKNVKRKKLWEEIRAQGIDAIKKENEFLKQECINLEAEIKTINLKGAAAFAAFEETKKERDNLKSEIETLKKNAGVAKSDYEAVKKEFLDLNKQLEDSNVLNQSLIRENEK